MKSIYQKITQWIRGIPAYILAKTWRRFCALVFVALCGVGLWWLSRELVRYFFGDEAHVTGWIEVFLLSIFVSLALWWFRTHDTKKQLAKADEQIKQNKAQFEEQGIQNDFSNGLESLASDNPLKINLGIQQLKILAEYDGKPIPPERIQDALIQRLTHMPRPTLDAANAAMKNSLDPLGETLPRQKRLYYAQHILHWLIARQKDGVEKPYLYGINCSHQVFNSHNFGGHKLQLNKIFPTFNDENTDKSQLYSVDFAGSSGDGLDFSDVIVCWDCRYGNPAIDLTGAYLLDNKNVRDQIKGLWKQNWVLDTPKNEFIKILQKRIKMPNDKLNECIKNCKRTVFVYSFYSLQSYAEGKLSERECMRLVIQKTQGMDLSEVEAKTSMKFAKQIFDAGQEKNALEIIQQSQGVEVEVEGIAWAIHQKHYNY